MSFTECKPTLPDLLQKAMTSHWEAKRGPLPGKIVSFDSSNQTATVTPVIKLYVDGELEDAPMLYDVPVAFPSGGGFSFTWPLEAGDYVDLLPQDIDIGAWANGGGDDEAPDSKRRWSLSDVVAIATFRPPSSPLASSCFAEDGSLWRDTHATIEATVKAVLESPDIRLGSSTVSTFLALASVCDSNFSALRDAVRDHIHAGVEPGAGSTAASGTVAAISSVATSKVRGE